MTVELVPLPRQPDGVRWPTAEWPTGPVPSHVDGARLGQLLDHAIGPDRDPRFGDSFAALVVHRGRIVAERYGSDADASTPLLSWSMAKSITHALVGILVEQGELDPDAPAPVPEWAGDARSAITLSDLLFMKDGLEFNETYSVPEGDDAAGWSHCIDMLFGAGKNAPAEYAIARPLLHEPGTVFNYSSGTSNIVARIVDDNIGRGDEATAWMRRHLFDPIGMTSADPTYDTNGDFIGSTYLHATARDWARFGLLYLRGGEWDGDQVLPAWWVDEARTTQGHDPDGSLYGSHWWTNEDGRGRFYASGYGFQRVVCVPSSDTVIVRLGQTAEDDYATPRAWIEDMVALFDE